jgi:hypothetical protein
MSQPALVTPFGLPRCWAGWRAWFGGRWVGIPPCTKVGRNHIAFVKDDGTFIAGTIDLCDEHFAQVDAAGLVEGLDPRYQR